MDTDTEIQLKYAQHAQKAMEVSKTFFSGMVCLLGLGWLLHWLLGWPRLQVATPYWPKLPSMSTCFRVHLTGSRIPVKRASITGLTAGSQHYLYYIQGCAQWQEVKDIRRSTKGGHQCSPQGQVCMECESFDRSGAPGKVARHMLQHVGSTWWFAQLHPLSILFFFFRIFHMSLSRGALRWAGQDVFFRVVW